MEYVGEGSWAGAAGLGYRAGLVVKVECDTGQACVISDPGPCMVTSH